jgi:hypothetical protein
MEDVTLTPQDLRKQAEGKSDHDLLLETWMDMKHIKEQFDPNRCVRHDERLTVVYRIGAGAWAVLLLIIGLLLKMAFG